MEERDTHFIALTKRFGSCANWSGYEHCQRNGWQRQGHIFGDPFYYIEYGITQLGALQVYRNFVKNNGVGLDGYIKGLQMGNSKQSQKCGKIWALNLTFLQIPSKN